MGRAGFIICLAITVCVCALLFTGSGSNDYDSTVPLESYYTREYNNSIIIPKTLNEYYPSQDVSAYSEINTVVFNSRIIPVPFDIADKEIAAKDNAVIIYQGEAPLFAVFIKGATAYYDDWPDLPDRVRVFLLIAILSTYGDSLYVQEMLNIAYSTKNKYLNTIPVINEDGISRYEDMYSPAINYKRTLENLYTAHRSYDEFSVMNVNINDSEINGLLYQTPGMRKVEIYRNDLLDYTFVVSSQEEAGDYIDYVLTYLYH